MTEHEQPCVGLVVLQQEVKNINSTILMHLAKFDKHMDNEEKTFGDIYTKLDNIGSNIASLRSDAAIEPLNCKSKFEEILDDRFNVYEKKLETYVTKHEVRLVWLTLTVVAGIFLWMFDGFSTIMKGDSSPKVIAELIEQQKMLASELEAHNKIMQQLAITPKKP